MRKVLVTGGAGQVGSRLVRQLLARDYEVKAVILPGDPNASRLNGLDVEVVEANLLDPAQAEAAVAGVDAVVHTANLVGRPQGMSEKEFFDNNVGTTFNVARAASMRADALERLVHISSSSVYPNDSHVQRCAYHPVDELHPKRPAGVYPLSKFIGEDIVRAFERETGLRIAIIRPSGIVSGAAVLGRWTVGFVSAILKAGQAHPESELYLTDGAEAWRGLEAAAQSPQQPCGATDLEGRPWVYQLADARDVAAGCICALESGAAIGEAFNIACPRPIPYPEAAGLLSEAVGLPTLEYRLPVRWVFDLDVTKARALMGYQPRWDVGPMIESALAVQRGEKEAM